MELECTFDIERDVRPFILSRRSEEARKARPDEAISIRVVGQERNGALLYTWDDLAPVGTSHDEVTHIGIYEPVEQNLKCIFVHDCKMFVVNCSINQEGSILAYVVKETEPATSETTEDTVPSSQMQDVYRAFLAEIQPQHAVFDMNLERSSLLHVQFLWPRSAQGLSDQSVSGSKECRLLVFLHRESIGLYRVPVARMGNSRVVMSGPPDALPVVSRFVWAQWDAPTQRLYVVLQRQGPPDDNQEQLVRFRCLEFTGQGSQTTFTKMMEMELPPEIKLPTSKYLYELPSLRNTISERAINMYVICQPSGSLCLCYQLPHKKLGGSRPSSRRQSRARAPTPPPTLQSEQRACDSDEIPRKPSYLNLTVMEEPGVPSGGGGGDVQGLPPQRTTPSTPLSSPGGSMDQLTAPTTPLTDSTSNRSQMGISSPQYWSTVSSPISDFPTSPVSNIRKLTQAQLDQKLLMPKPRTNQFVEVHYIILVLHHKAILHCSVPHVHRSIARRMQLSFTPMNGYIMVFYPGTVLHLLNVNPEMEPSLHLAFEPQDIPWIPLPGASPSLDQEPGKDPGAQRVEQLRAWRPVMTHCLRDRTSSRYDDLLFDGLSGRCYQPAINKEKLPQLMVGDSLTPVKLGLLHLAVINLKDASLNKKIMESITRDPSQLELHDLLGEFLLAGTFCCVRLKLEREILRFLPFTKMDTTKTVLIETLDGTRLSCFKAVENRYIPKIYLSKKGRRDKRLGADANSSLWEALERHIGKNQEWVNTPSKRFDTRSLSLKLRDQELVSQILRREDKTAIPSNTQGPRPSLFKKVAAFSRKALSSSKDAKQVQPKDALIAGIVDNDKAKASGIDTDQNKHIEMILEDLVSFFRSRMPFHNQDRLVSYATEFVTSQLQQFKQMMGLLLTANGFSDDWDTFAQIPLSQPASEDEENLFQIVERLFSAAQNLCFPLPIGFKHFFVCLGYRCLEASMFLQYVAQGVFELSEPFMSKLIREIEDGDKRNVSLKMDLILRLPKVSADKILAEWDHPSSTLIVAQQYAASCVNDGAELNQRNLSAAMAPQTKSHKSRKKSIEAAIPGREVEEDFLDAIPDFPPLTYFMRFIEGAEKTWHVPKNRPDIYPKVDSTFVGRVALQRSVQDHGLDLGGIAF